MTSNQSFEFDSPAEAQSFLDIIDPTTRVRVVVYRDGASEAAMGASGPGVTTSEPVDEPESVPEPTDEPVGEAEARIVESPTERDTAASDLIEADHRDVPRAEDGSVDVELLNQTHLASLSQNSLDHQILSFLADHPTEGFTADEVAKNIDAFTGSVSASLSNLSRSEQADLARRIPQHDQRASTYRVTDIGVEVAESLGPFHRPARPRSGYLGNELPEMDDEDVAMLDESDREYKPVSKRRTNHHAVLTVLAMAENAGVGPLRSVDIEALDIVGDPDEGDEDYVVNIASVGSSLSALRKRVLAERPERKGKHGYPYVITSSGKRNLDYLGYDPRVPGDLFNEFERPYSLDSDFRLGGEFAQAGSGEPAPADDAIEADVGETDSDTEPEPETDTDETETERAETTVESDDDDSDDDDGDDTLTITSAERFAEAVERHTDSPEVGGLFDLVYPKDVLVNDRYVVHGKNRKTDGELRYAEVLDLGGPYDEALESPEPMYAYRFRVTDKTARLDEVVEVGSTDDVETIRPLPQSEMELPADVATVISKVFDVETEGPTPAAPAN